MSAKRSLIETNPFLRDSAKRASMIVDFVFGANRLEGIQVTKKKTREHYETTSSRPTPRRASKIVKG
ncbi:MAG: hypothetical protein V2A56_09500 [bacterium]